MEASYKVPIPWGYKVPIPWGYSSDYELQSTSYSSYSSELQSTSYSTVSYYGAVQYGAVSDRLVSPPPVQSLGLPEPDRA